MRTSMFRIVEAGEQLPFLDQYQCVQCAVCLGKTLVMPMHFLHSTSSDEEGIPGAQAGLQFTLISVWEVNQ